MTEIVCDTNIWYGIGLGLITEHHWGENKLVGTYLNLDELLRTQKFLEIGKINIIRKATKACGQNHTKILNSNPFIHVLQIDGQIGDTNFEFDNFLFKFTQEFGNGNVSDEEAHDILKELIIQRREELENILKVMEEWLNPIIAQKPKPYNYKELLPIAQERLNDSIEGWTKIHMGKEYSISSRFDWDKIELFIHVYAAFLRHVSVSALKLEVNHFYDLYNLIYVNQQRQYWTKEKKWIELISNFIKMDRYLFTPDTPLVSPSHTAPPPIN